MELLNSIILAITDPVLNWLLYLPIHLILVIIALGTALFLTVIRIWTCDQKSLKAYKADKDIIKGLLKKAKEEKDKERIAQLKTSMNQIDIKKFKAEGKPLLASIVPIALVAVWALARLGYIAPEEGEPVNVSVFGPVTEIGDIVHAVPQDGITAGSGWIQRVCEDLNKDGKVVAGRSDWTFTMENRENPYDIMFVYPEKKIHADIRMGSRTYEPVITQNEDTPEYTVQVNLRKFKAFGFMKGNDVFPGWLIAYLIIVIPMYLILKPVLKIE